MIPNHPNDIILGLPTGSDVLVHLRVEDIVLNENELLILQLKRRRWEFGNPHAEEFLVLRIEFDFRDGDGLVGFRRLAPYAEVLLVGVGAVDARGEGEADSCGA